MDTKELIPLAKAQLKGKYALYTILLFFCMLIATILNLHISIDEDLINQPLTYVLYLCMSLLWVIIRNTIYFLFIKRVRKEVFQLDDIQYSFRKAGLHLCTLILFELIQYTMLFLIQIVATIIPFLSLPLVIIMQVILSGISVFIAFAIYDGIKGAMNIVNGSIRLFIREYKNLFMMAMPFFIWLLLYQLCSNLLVLSLTSNGSGASVETLTMAWSIPELHSYVYAFVGLELLHLVMSVY